MLIANAVIIPAVVARKADVKTSDATAKAGIEQVNQIIKSSKNLIIASSLLLF
jgi:hypothetical protein